MPHDSETIEVIMRKQMTYKEYKEFLKKNHKGWHVQGYQENVFTEPIKKKV